MRGGMGERRERSERRLQDLVFAGAVVILALVLGTSWIVQREQRKQERDAQALISPPPWLPSPTRTILPTATMPNRVTLLPGIVILTLHPTRTPTPTATPAPTPRQLLLGSDPTDEEIALFFYDRHIQDPRYRDDILNGSYAEVDKRYVDLDNDGRPEILVSGKFGWARVFVAVLGQDEGGWREWLFTLDIGRYGTAVRATLEDDLILAEFITRGGGTGVLIVDWRQDWIRCQEGDCAVVWSGWLMRADRSAPFACHNALGYMAVELERPDAETIHLIRRHFAVYSFLPGEYDPQDYCQNLTHRSVGPDDLEVYRWNGSEYQLESSQVLVPKHVITQELTLSSQETVRQVDDFLRQSFNGADGTIDEEGFWVSRAAFWGLNLTSGVAITPCTSWHQDPDVAAHNGGAGQLGEWVAGLVGAEGCSSCRLTAQHLAGHSFTLSGRAELTCTINLSRLDWVDVTGDGREELLLLTVPPAKWYGSSQQTVYLYSVEDGLEEVARLNGDFNGPDGAGVRWEDLDGDGVVELLAGLPLIDFDAGVGVNEEALWPELFRRFQVYRWDAAGRGLVAGEVVTVPWE